PDGGAIPYGAAALPPARTLPAATGLIAGTLSFASTGTYSVTATVSDGTLSDSKTFTWTVTNVNRAPTLTAPTNQTSAENAAISLQRKSIEQDSRQVTDSDTGRST